jgi:hypothetical protein
MIGDVHVVRVAARDARDAAVNVDPLALQLLRVEDMNGGAGDDVVVEHTLALGGRPSSSAAAVAYLPQAPVPLGEWPCCYMLQTINSEAPPTQSAAPLKS